MSLDRKMILPPTNSAVVMSSARRSTSSSTGTTGFGNIAGNIATEPRGVASVPLVASAPSYPSSSGSNMMLTTASSNSKTTTTRFVWPAAPVARPCLTPPQPLQLPNLVPLSARSSTISSAR
ncbi:unnamed protein product [Amoebophrya sp. A25]|nr:unnamed protein product [Amoebophrya sp. A25]|eukprot:GSA25T00008708001.1